MGFWVTLGLGEVLLPYLHPGSSYLGWLLWVTLCRAARAATRSPYLAGTTGLRARNPLWVSLPREAGGEHVTWSSFLRRPGSSYSGRATWGLLPKVVGATGRGLLTSVRLCLRWLRWSSYHPIPWLGARSSYLAPQRADRPGSVFYPWGLEFCDLRSCWICA